jgi:hypothetical protein
VLLFHKQVQLVKAIHYSAILLLIITERLSKTNESKAAFVFNFVAHGVAPIPARLSHSGGAIGRGAKLVHYERAAKKNPHDKIMGIKNIVKEIINR